MQVLEQFLLDFDIVFHNVYEFKLFADPSELIVNLQLVITSFHLLSRAVDCIFLEEYFLCFLASTFKLSFIMNAHAPLLLNLLFQNRLESLLCVVFLLLDARRS